MMKSLVLVLCLVASGCSYHRIGSLTIASTRNIDASKEYVLLKRGVEGKSNGASTAALEEAMERATNAWGGEYMMNVSMYVNGTGKRVKVQGDVWGLPGSQPPATGK
jgi:hypothetical protein